MKKSHLILGLVVIAALVALVVWGHDRIHFDFAVFRSQIVLANWGMIGAGVGCIYLGYVFRSARWALLMKHNKRVGPFSLIGAQVIGFTAIALIGRVADPVRPYLVAKKTGEPLSEQIAVYIVERLFDMGSMALIFSIAMFWVSSAQILDTVGHSGFLAKISLHHQALAVFIARYGGLISTLIGAVVLVLIRLSGNAVAAFFERTLGLVSKSAGHAVAHKVRTFHAGLDTMRTFADFAWAASLSLVMWLFIAGAYFETCRAFTASQELATLTPPKCVLLMIASGGASVLQLPVLGWFSQIGIVAVALTAVLGASPEAGLACAATLLLVTFLSVIPVGLIWAQFEHVSLRKVTAESEHEAEELAENAE